MNELTNCMHMKVEFSYDVIMIDEKEYTRELILLVVLFIK
jgi:hypothetical protein